MKHEFDLPAANSNTTPCTTITQYVKRKLCGKSIPSLQLTRTLMKSTPRQRWRCQEEDAAWAGGFCKKRFQKPVPPPPATTHISATRKWRSAKLHTCCMLRPGPPRYGSKRVACPALSLVILPSFIPDNANRVQSACDG